MNVLSSLRYLVALSEHRHFARAAEACHITQPALSNALRALEAEYGTQIVRRGRVYAGLTEEGERILLAARRMLHEHELLQQELRARGNEPQGRLRMGVVPTAVSVATRFAVALHELHPGISVTLRSMRSTEIEAGLEDLTLDLGLGFAERVERRPRFRHLPQYEERYFLLMLGDEGQGLRVGAACGWAEAAREPLGLLTPENHHRQVVDAAFRQAGVEAHPVLETDSVTALMLAVTSGSIRCVVPGALAAAAPQGLPLLALPLVRPAIVTPVAFFTLASESDPHALEAALAFAQAAPWRKEVSALAGRLSSFKQ
ncbi:LysR family transcriptional regulator [Caenimonas sedimenti]|uniref:LysR family transcriptional regulator n=1 Tax=Caenimonas sedimenti TaxID=2596921 RepID=A0A562ZL98_9BURK|nr:LysR substrate-binding domain-containing protein [Caenimonas sedimenti]TWO69340.1 LysR family transcriptional regulator [Caenimonas sedimenti]